jgi:hypothetical protein
LAVDGSLSGQALGSGTIGGGASDGGASDCGGLGGGADLVAIGHDTQATGRDAWLAARPRRAGHGDR